MVHFENSFVAIGRWLIGSTEVDEQTGEFCEGVDAGPVLTHPSGPCTAEAEVLSSGMKISEVQ